MPGKEPGEATKMRDARVSPGYNLEGKAIMAKQNILARGLEYLGHYQTIQTIMQAEFVRTLLVPIVTALATGSAGILGGLPLMWIFMATAVAGAAAAVGIQNASTYLERKNPAHKLTIIKTLFNFDLVPVNPPNRRHRRAAASEGGAPAVPAHRHFVKGQLGVEVWNRSSFPISVIVVSADTEIEGLRPPRVKFPKDPVIIAPGTTVWVHDEAIDLQNMDCDNLDGRMDVMIKYGLPGKEHFEIRQTGTVEIFMEGFGQFKGLYFHPAQGNDGVPGDVRP